MVANPIHVIYRLIPSPSRFEIRQLRDVFMWEQFLRIVVVTFRLEIKHNWKWHLLNLKLHVAGSIWLKISVQPEQELIITAPFINTPHLLNQRFLVSLPSIILVDLSGNRCLHVFQWVQKVTSVGCDWWIRLWFESFLVVFVICGEVLMIGTLVFRSWSPGWRHCMCSWVNT